MSDEQNISPFEPGRDKLSEEKLMAYLEGKLSQAERHEVEQWLNDEGMESDALEGLMLQQPADTRQTVRKLNHTMRTAILSKKRKRKTLKTELVTWSAILIILLLAVLAYIVIRKSI